MVRVWRAGIGCDQRWTFIGEVPCKRGGGDFDFHVDAQNGCLEGLSAVVGVDDRGDVDECPAGVGLDDHGGWGNRQALEGAFD